MLDFSSILLLLFLPSRWMLGTMEKKPSELLEQSHVGWILFTKKWDPFDFDRPTPPGRSDNIFPTERAARCTDPYGMVEVLPVRFGEGVKQRKGPRKGGAKIFEAWSYEGTFCRSFFFSLSLSSRPTDSSHRKRRGKEEKKPITTTTTTTEVSSIFQSNRLFGLFPRRHFSGPHRDVNRCFHGFYLIDSPPGTNTRFIPTALHLLNVLLMCTYVL